MKRRGRGRPIEPRADYAQDVAVVRRLVRVVRADRRRAADWTERAAAAGEAFAALLERANSL